MSAANKQTIFVTGKLSWAKVLGAPVVNYNKDGREWAFEVEPNEAGIQKLLKAGLADRIKGKGYNIGTKGQHKEREPFIQLKKGEFTKDGNPNTPIRIYDEDDNLWDAKLNEQGNPTNLIGNGSEADVKLDVRDYGPGKKSGVYPAAIRVTDHVPYESTEFGNMDEQEGEAYAGNAPVKRAKAVKKDTVAEDFGTPEANLDDDVPF